MQMQNARKKRGTLSAPDRKQEGLAMEQLVYQEAVRLSMEHGLGSLNDLADDHKRLRSLTGFPHLNVTL